MWFKVDDKLWGHPKWLSVSMRARGLWVSAGSWSAANETDGKIPRHVLRTLGGTPSDAKVLVEASLWREARAGWVFHEWGIYQPDAASLKAKRSAEVEGGIWGNHRRWHIGKNVTVPGCAYCDGMPPEGDVEPSESDRVPDRGSIGGPESGASRPVPEPEPDVQLSKNGGLPKQREGNDQPPIQPCGERHPSAKACHACGVAAIKAKEDALANKRAKEARARAEALAADAAAIKACDLCDSKGRSGDKVCHHVESTGMTDEMRAAFRTQLHKPTTMKTNQPGDAA